MSPGPGIVWRMIMLSIRSGSCQLQDTETQHRPALTITQQQQQTALCSPSKQNIASKFCVTVGGSISQSDIHSPNILTLSCIYSAHRGHHSKVESYMYVVEVNNPHIYNFNPPIFYEQSLILTVMKVILFSGITKKTGPPSPNL